MGKHLKATGFLTKLQIYTVQGLDWHGPSAIDVWESLDALTTVLEKRVYEFPEFWGIERHTQVLMMGHSNGGQGTWYLSSRYPDRILGGMECGMCFKLFTNSRPAIPAAAYIKSQAYVPLTMARSKVPMPVFFDSKLIKRLGVVISSIPSFVPF